MDHAAFCQVCGAGLAPAARFCPGCGEHVAGAAPSAATMTDPALARGWAALQAGDIDRAIPLLAAPAAAGSPLALLAYGTALLRRGRYEEAVAPLERAVAALPERGEPLAYLAMARLHVVDVGGAREAMDAALMLAPDSFAVRMKHTELLLRLGYYREALDEAEATLRLTAPDAESLAFAERLAGLARKRAKNSFTRRPGRLPNLRVPIGVAWRWARSWRRAKAPVRGRAPV